jgi:hypothetical protein
VQTVIVSIHTFIIRVYSCELTVRAYSYAIVVVTCNHMVTMIMCDGVLLKGNSSCGSCNKNHVISSHII